MLDALNKPKNQSSKISLQEEEFTSFEKETNEVRIIQELTKQKQEIPSLPFSISGINYYRF
jgi:hypothetical protein